MGSYISDIDLYGLYLPEMFCCIFPPSSDCHMILVCELSYLLMFLEVSNPTGGSRSPLAIHPLQDAAPGGQEHE